MKDDRRTTVEDKAASGGVKEMQVQAAVAVVDSVHGGGANMASQLTH